MRKLEIRIRPLNENDLDAVLEIEREVFPSPWSREAFLRELENEKAVFLVAEKEREIVGYGGFFSVLDEAHITNLAVSPLYQRIGIGSLILLHLIDYARRRGIRRFTLEVRKSNRAARLLYEKFGFSIYGIRERYYEDTGEDALIFWTRDITTPEYRRKFQEIADNLRKRGIVVIPQF